MIKSDQPFTLGVNYWPRNKAMYWWSDFDEGEVDEEFALIRDLGMSVVRIFLLWDDFQPDPHSVSPDALRSLAVVCDLAAKYALGLDVTFFTGHMSGPNWTPRWLAGGPLPPYPIFRQIVSQGKLIQNGYRNMFHDPRAIEASRLLLRTIVEEFKLHPAIWMWNLGNEPDLFAWPDSPSAGRLWVQEMAALIKSIDPIHPVTCGLHTNSLLQENGLRISDVYAETDVAVMHAYPMYSPWAREPLDPDYVPFTVALTASLCGKQVLMEEFGGCTAPEGKQSFVWEWAYGGKKRSQFMASEEDLAEYLAQVLPRLVQIGATGALVWCFADYARTLWDRPPCDFSQHERFFGLVRPDGSLKPHAQVIKEFANSKPVIQPVPDYARLTIEPKKFYENPAVTTQRLYGGYLERLKNSGNRD